MRALRASKRAAWTELWPKKNWHGIYRTFSEVGEPSKAFNVVDWIESSRRLLLETRAQNASMIPAAVNGDESLLPIVVAMLDRGTGPVRVVDFGGAAGVSYAMAKAALPPQTELDYTVVELAPIVRLGRELFADDPSVHFVSEIPAPAEPVDIVFISTALQYVDAWQVLLRDLTNLRPRKILFSRLSAGDIPTFITTQVNHSGSPTPYRFLNLVELKDAMDRFGYELRFAGASLTRLDQNDFPDSHRLHTACNLLFSRKAE